MTTVQPETTLGDNTTPPEQIGATPLPDGSAFGGTPATRKEAKVAETEASALPEGGISAWIAGVRPTRRGMYVYQRFDIQAEIDQLAELEMRAKGSDKKPYQERATELTEQLLASRIWFEFEARDEAWIEALHADLDRKNKKDDFEHLLHQMAEQIITPQGVTVDDLKALHKASPAQVGMLKNKLIEAQTHVPVVNPRFLRESSDA